MVNPQFKGPPLRHHPLRDAHMLLLQSPAFLDLISRLNLCICSRLGVLLLGIVVLESECGGPH